MSKELPWYKFYPTEWLLGRISHESNELQVSFLKTCCWYWQRECDLDIDYLNKYVDAKTINELCKKDYIKYNKKNRKISIKFLDEQSKERKERKIKRVESGRIGGKKSASMRKKKTKEDYIQEAMHDPDPAQCLNREVAEILINGKIERGEITI